MTDFSDDLEYWMTNLPYTIKDIPIINLAIPGSHDSMSYGIKSSSSVAPDADTSISTLNKFAPCVVRRWAITQDLSVTNQLLNGIRYFDLRFGLKVPDNKFFFVHGLYCDEILKPLVELKKFLDDHTGEIAILDCQHFYNFNHHDHDKLCKILTKLFENKIFGRRDGSLDICTLNKMISNKKQILIIYRNKGTVTSEFWPSYMWPTPWPNEISVNKLQSYLTRSLQIRPVGVGYVSQCVLTPTAEFIVPRFLFSLRSSCAKKVNKKLVNWITEQSPGVYKSGDKPTANVFLADFINIKGSSFCKWVVQLNEKLIISEEIDLKSEN